MVRHQLDPFFAECRAFGHLIELNQDDELAVRCHGYVMLSSEIEKRIIDNFDIQDWNREAEDENQPLKAIVKDLVCSNSFLGKWSFRTMRKKIKRLHELGIYNMDIRTDNYLNGRLFDFSAAITTPHLDLWTKLRPEDEILEDINDDFECFDSVIKAEKKKTRDAWMDRLRPRG